MTAVCTPLDMSLPDFAHYNLEQQGSFNTLLAHVGTHRADACPMSTLQK